MVSSSGMFPAQTNTPMTPFDYLTRRGLNDAFYFVGKLIKEGPSGAYEQTTRAFQSKVSQKDFAAYIRKYPAILRIIRFADRTPPDAVRIIGGESNGSQPNQLRWEGDLPTNDELHPTIYLELIMEDGNAKVNRIRVRKDTLPSS